MLKRRLLLTVVVVVVLAGAWALVVFLVGGGNAAPAGAGANGPPTASRKITARLFYVADDGMNLVAVEQEVPFGEGTAEQARRIVEAQLAPPSGTLRSAVPPGTTLRTLFLTERGHAFVDLSREVAAAHQGGSTSELLTVYAIVDALTANLPAITAVQILVEGRQVDTLAGHVDLRRPLPGDPSRVEGRRGTTLPVPPLPPTGG